MPVLVPEPMVESSRILSAAPESFSCFCKFGRKAWSSKRGGIYGEEAGEDANVVVLLEKRHVCVAVQVVSCERCRFYGGVEVGDVVNGN